MDILNLDYLQLFNLAKDQAMTIDKDLIFAFSAGTLIGSAIILLRRFIYSFKYPYVATSYKTTPESKRFITTVHKIISKAPLIPVFNAKLGDFVLPKNSTSKGLKKFANKRIHNSRVPVIFIHAQTHRPMLIMFDLPGNKSSYLSRTEMTCSARAAKAAQIPIYSPGSDTATVQEHLHHISRLLKASKLPPTEEMRQAVPARVEPIDGPSDPHQEQIIDKQFKHVIDNEPAEPITPEKVQPSLANHHEASAPKTPSSHLTKKWYSAAKLKSTAKSISPRVDASSIRAAASILTESTRHAVKRATDSIDEASKKMDTSVGNSSNPGLQPQAYAEPEFKYEDLDDPLEAEMRAAKNTVIAVKPNQEFFPEDNSKDEEYSLFGGSGQSAPINRRITPA